ncbi:MAG: hypothetical protein ACLVIV_00895, partial [Acutalibacteraceae bacterium]
SRGSKRYAQLAIAENRRLFFITKRSGVTKQGLPSSRGSKRYAQLAIAENRRLFFIMRRSGVTKQGLS